MTERELEFQEWWKSIGGTDSMPASKASAWAAWQAALESRVLAERKPIYQIQSGYGWIDISEKEFNDLGNYGGKRALFTHPTPDDASLVPVNVWILPDPLSVREGAFEYSGLFLTRSPGVAERNNGERLYRKAAIDRAMQSGEEGK